MGLFSAGSIDIEIEMHCKRGFFRLCCCLSGLRRCFRSWREEIEEERLECVESFDISSVVCINCLFIFWIVR